MADKLKKSLCTIIMNINRNIKDSGHFGGGFPIWFVISIAINLIFIPHFQIRQVGMPRRN